MILAKIILQIDGTFIDSLMCFDELSVGHIEKKTYTYLYYFVLQSFIVITFRIIYGLFIYVMRRLIRIIFSLLTNNIIFLIKYFGSLSQYLIILKRMYDTNYEKSIFNMWLFFQKYYTFGVIFFGNNFVFKVSKILHVKRFVV